MSDKKTARVTSTRLLDRYKAEIVPALVKKFEYKSVMQVPKLDKIVINIGVGDATSDSKRLDECVSELALISGQKPVITKAKNSIATFKLREGPVFSGFTGGLGKLMGPTGGYLIGFIPMALIAGLFIEKFDSKVMHFVGMALGTIVCYAFGTAWFCYLAGVGLHKALAACVIPFLPGDTIKIVISLFVGPVLVKALTKAHLLN